MNELLEIVEKPNDVTYEIPQVKFLAYEEYKQKAQTVADYIRQMDVDPENLKDTKQLLANARKVTERLNRIRIDMKKEILQNYTLFESQVNEIVGIVGDADRELRAKVKALEEAEREEKEQEIFNIWQKRVAPYPIIEATMTDAFHRWLSPKHLNKTTTMKAVEKDMTEWIEKTYNEMQTALGMGREYLIAYGWKGDLAGAIEAVNTNREAEKRLNGLDDDEETKETFIVYGRKDIDLTKMLLNEHNINYILL